MRLRRLIRDVPHEFPKRLKELRQRRGLSQKQLAMMCRLSQSAISNYENGTRALAIEVLNLARALDVSPLWLAEGRGPKTPPIYPQLAEPTASDASHWPFKSFSAEDINNLSERDKAIVEATLNGLLLALKNNKIE